LSARSSFRVSALHAGVAAVLAAAFAGCGFPDFTYDLPEDGAVGAGGSAGSAGAAGAAGDASVEADAETGAGGSGGTQPEAGDEPEPDVHVEADAAGEDGQVEEDVVEAGQDDALDATQDPETSDEPDVAVDVVDADAADVITEEAAVQPETGAEDCTNGKDDDGDGKIDCQDSDCTPLYKCVTAPPGGWTGWIQLYEGPASGVPECATPFSTLVIAAGRDPSATATACSGCACGSPIGASCSEANLVIWENSTCDSETGWGNFVFTPYGACKGWNLNSSDGGVAIPVAASFVSLPSHEPGTGFCSPSGGVPSLPTPQWSTVGAACEADQVGGGCSGTSVCAPKPSSSFKTGLCIYRTGVTNCPAGAYSSKYTFYQNWADTRGCSTCACESPSGVSCQASMTIATSSTCAGASVEATFSDQGCYPLQPNTLQYLQYNPQAPSGGSCQPQGGTPEGTLTNDVASAYTVCCMPF
jgi:hypothetical protein